jgi:hypothetical protein
MPLEDDWVMSEDMNDPSAQPSTHNYFSGDRAETASPTVPLVSIQVLTWKFPLETQQEDDQAMLAEDLDSDEGPSVSVLEWTSPTPPPRVYTQIKGVAESIAGGFVLRCNIFRGRDTPHADLGDVSDIYIDGAAETVFAKVETQDGHPYWVQWRLSSSIIHPLVPAYELTAQRSLGIKWSTTNAVRIAKTRGHLAPTIKFGIQRTYDTFPQLLAPIPKVHPTSFNRSVPEYSNPSASPNSSEQSLVPDPEEEWYGFTDPVDEVSRPLSPITPPPPTRSLIQRLRDLPESFLKRAGIEFPSFAKCIQWVSGIWTPVPWHTVAGNRTNPVQKYS